MAYAKDILVAEIGQNTARMSNKELLEDLYQKANGIYGWLKGN
jgi:hypothetical protein